MARKELILPPGVKSEISFQKIRARYDAAQTTDENTKHWLGSDTLSADAANSSATRKTLRQRARYETANSSYLRGFQFTIANDMIGSGPRLQSLLDTKIIPGADVINDALETLFLDWSRFILLAEKLNISVAAQVDTGEAFGIIQNNPGLQHDITLDLSLVEADQCYTPTEKVSYTDPLKTVDGMLLDQYGNVVEYYFNEVHPGSGFSSTKFFIYKPNQVCHYYRPDRPGQHRGIPWSVPALETCAKLRRYTDAVLAAAEVAADLSGVIYSEAPAGGDLTELDPLEAVEFYRRMLMTLPSGWRIQQIKAEQPCSTYAEFKKEVLQEIARCFLLPYIVAAGNSSDANYASGRLDYQVYRRALSVERARIERRILEPLFTAWVQLAKLALVEEEGLREIIAIEKFPHTWIWEDAEHVDPLKEANAQKTRIGNLTTTYADEFARQKKDWRESLKQRAVEEAYIKELGLTREQAAPQKTEQTPEPQPQGGNEENA